MAPQRNFTSRVPHVQPGSPVSASNTSASTRALEARTNYLKEVLESIEAGRLLVHEHQTLDPELLEGHAVFWNDETKRFEAALAAVENDSETNTLVAMASADCLGIVLIKDSADKGTVGTVGMAKLTPTQLANMVDGEATPGRYYLSAAEAGKLVRQRPPVTVAVVYVLGPASDCETDSWVFILPQMKDFLEDHIHFQFSLAAKTAGTHVIPDEGEQHAIINADTTLQGWLPADHESFNGLAPSGAKFGYNMAAHQALDRAWPPVPLAAVLLEAYHNTIGSSHFPVAGRVLPEHVRFTRHGIWWMTDCYDEVPWPVVFVLGSESSSESSSAGSSCPVTNRMRLILSFIKMTFLTDKSVVTSLQPDTDEPIEFVNCDGDTANTGDLFARLNILALLDDDEYFGGQVLKEIVDSELKFGRGWVAEGLIAGSDKVSLSSTHSRFLTPGDEETPEVHQGIVTVDVTLDPTERDLAPQIVKLGDALEREYKGILYIGLPNDRDSGIRMRINVPPVALPTSPMMKIRVKLFGRDDGPWSELTMSYYRVTRPEEGSPVPIVEGDTALTFDVVTPSTGVDVDNVIEVESEEFEIAPGDTVFVSLLRAADASPLFEAEIGIVRVGGIIVAGT